MSVINLSRKDAVPFAQIPNAAIRDPKITPNAFRLLAYLMSHQDGYNLTYDQIETQTGMGRYAINEASKLLVDLGWLQVNRPKVDGKFACKQWVVLNPDANESTAGDSTMEQHHMGQSTDNIRTSITKENHLVKNTIVNAQSDFEKFWEAYPRKVGKGEAKKAFMKQADSVIAILSGALRLANDPNLPPAQFIPHPATWLNRQGWWDEPYPERDKSPEEKAVEQTDRARRIMDAQKQAAQEAIMESREAAKRATPPPKCIHGISIIQCRNCLLGLN